MKTKWKELKWWKKLLIIVIPLMILGAIAPKQQHNNNNSCCCIYTDRSDNATGYKGSNKRMKIKTDEFTCRDLLLGEAEYHGNCSDVAVED